MRTTINIDISLLTTIRKICHREDKTITRVIQELLALGVSTRNKRLSNAPPFGHWHAKDMRPLVNYRDKEALNNILDQRP